MFYNPQAVGLTPIINNQKENTDQLIESIEKLNKNIEKMDNNTTKWSKMMIYFTFLLFIIGLTQVFMMFKEATQDSWSLIFVVIFYVVFLLLFSIKMFKDLKNFKRNSSFLKTKNKMTKF